MLATRFVGRHWVALVLVLGVMLLVIGGRVGRDFGLYFLFRSDLSADGAPDARLSVLASRPFLTGFYLSYLVSFLYCYALAQDAVERGRAKGKTDWLDADPATVAPVDHAQSPAFSDLAGHDLQYPSQRDHRAAGQRRPMAQSSRRSGRDAARVDHRARKLKCLRKLAPPSDPPREDTFFSALPSGGHPAHDARHQYLL